MTTIAVVDYGMGNLRSVAKALEHVAPKARVTITGEARAIDAADRVVLPGQGAMPDCMRHLAESGLHEALLRAATTRPLFGVCVGEQMLFEWSAEGDTPGLGLLAGKVLRFPDDVMRAAQGARLKVPHMGWNRVEPTGGHRLWEGITPGSFFYFAHSFFAAPDDLRVIAATSEHGLRFTCAVARDNIFATQFHPEKSAANGLKLYENFVSWNP